ncbi:MAG: cell division protein SepF [Actinomycetia bacterium]|nr:cell division protein SepF [Actinomycetes bacterium]
MGNKFKDDIPVIINLQRVEQELAKRIIDFASGLTFGLDGGIQRVADRVFLITPHNVEVSAEEKVKLQERGLFNQF